jgi:hypothetical protein
MAWRINNLYREERIKIKFHKRWLVVVIALYYNCVKKSICGIPTIEIKIIFFTIVSLKCKKGEGNLHCKFINIKKTLKKNKKKYFKNLENLKTYLLMQKVLYFSKNKNFHRSQRQEDSGSSIMRNTTLNGFANLS